MKIICLIKFVPNVDEMIYDSEKCVLVRENINQIINPDDACALGFALQLKKKYKDIQIEVLTMAPLSVKPLVEDILRRCVDKAVILSDRIFGGSDTLATSRILGAYLKNEIFDVILTGDHSLDGDTAHIPSQIAQILNVEQISSVMQIDEASFMAGNPVVITDAEGYEESYQIEFPAVLSIGRASKIRLPYVRFADRKLKVEDRIKIISNVSLGLDKEQIGAHGSATHVERVWVKDYDKKNKQIHVKVDEEGVAFIYHFLKNKGYLS